MSQKNIMETGNSDGIVLLIPSYPAPSVDEARIRLGIKKKRRSVPMEWLDKLLIGIGAGSGD